MSQAKIFWALILILVAGGIVAFFENIKKDKPVSNNDQITQNNIKGTNIKSMETLGLTSSAFQNDGYIPAKYTCDGENINPPLSIAKVPAGTQSLVLVLHDPDAPAAGGFLHWIMWNIDPQTAEIPENSVLEGATQGNNGAGKIGYTGPCPPSGTHHYNFYLYALDVKLDLPSLTNKSKLESAMQNHILAQTLLTGLYKR